MSDAPGPTAPPPAPVREPRAVTRFAVALWTPARPGAPLRRAAHRLGGRAAAPLLASVAGPAAATAATPAVPGRVVDVLRYGPLADSVPGRLSPLNILPGWLFAYQLGVAWGDGRIARRGAWTLLVGGVVLFATLLTVFHHPASMVGVPGEARTNSHPPSLLALALAAAQSGAAILLRDRLARLLARPALWAPVVVINLCATTILCRQRSAMPATAVPGSFVGELAGLTTAPDSLGWIAARPARMPVFAALLVGTARYARRFEEPWTRATAVRRTLAGVLAAGFAVFALGLA